MATGYISDYVVVIRSVSLNSGYFQPPAFLPSSRVFIFASYSGGRNQRKNGNGVAVS